MFDHYTFSDRQHKHTISLQQTQLRHQCHFPIVQTLDRQGVNVAKERNGWFYSMREKRQAYGNATAFQL